MHHQKKVIFMGRKGGKFQTFFWEILFLIMLFLFSFFISNRITLTEFIMLSTLIFSIMIGIVSMFNPFFLMRIVKKKVWKILVISSFFIGIAFIIIGFLYDGIFYFVSLPFITIFLIQFIIEVLDYYGLSHYGQVTSRLLLFWWITCFSDSWFFWLSYWSRLSWDYLIDVNEYFNMFLK